MPSDLEGNQDTHQPMPSDLGTRVRARLGVLVPVEAAAALGVTTRTLDTWRSEGRGPDFIKAGGRVLYRESDLADWLNLNVIVTSRIA